MIRSSECIASDREIERLSRLVAIVESTDDAIISGTADGFIASWNPAAERMFGYRADEAIGRSVHLIVPSERADEESMLMGRIGKGEHIRQFETIRQHKDGRRLSVSITFSPLWGSEAAAGGVPRIVGVSKIIRDITERKQTEAVAEREMRFAKSLIETTPGVLYLFDRNGSFLRWNRNFEVVSGYSAEEIAHMRPLDFFDESEKWQLDQQIGDVFTKGEATVEAGFRAKDGRCIPYFFTGKRIVFDCADCLVGVGIDISKRRLAEEAVRKNEARYRRTLDSILEGCQLIGFDWRYLYLNDAAATQNRRPKAELLGRSMPEAWAGIEASPVFALLNRCMERRVAVHEETKFVFSDGATAWFDVRAQPVPEGLSHWCIDITERKRAEQALHELNESLERKIVERTVDLEAAKERAEAADRIKSAFLATMSHELRTPLNSIIGFTGILIQGMTGPLNPEQNRQLGMVRGSAHHLLELINDVLDISKIEAGQLDLQLWPFALPALVERAAALVKPLADQKGLALRVQTPPVLEMVSDRRRVEQIVLNLLNNAIKFTDHGGVTLTVDVVAVPEPTVRIQVADTGIGMKRTDLTRLFQPFQQLDAGIERQHEGTGLGLAICGRLSVLLGGTIRAESEWGQGSVFIVTLPITRRQSAS